MNAERECCHAVAALLAAHGVKRAVVSPGSRNAPLIEALDSVGSMHLTVVIDERSAAFMALGMASVTGECVALVCTSGSALLNYAPALAEAYYRHIPLVAISADRAHEWIDRNDGQTILQPTAYGEFVKRRFNIDSRDSAVYRDLVVNDAVNLACGYPCGPVHVNIEIPDPSLTDNAPSTGGKPRHIKKIGRGFDLDRNDISQLAGRLGPDTRVMVVAGCYKPDQRLNKALGRLCSFGNFIVMADAISNLHGQGIITTVDTVLSGISHDIAESLRPDIVISHGGAILSARLKSYLRDGEVEHWHVGGEEVSQDTFGSMSLTIDTAPECFYRQIIAAMRHTDAHSDYSMRWIRYSERAIATAREYIANSPWCDMSVISRVLALVPRRFNVQLSNGMSVRYAQLLPYGHHRYDCNRGVSGIEGSTSTAIGASACYNEGTILITGDMSAAYDMHGLSLESIPARFKMVVVANNGGGIFNYIKGTCGYEHVNRYLAAQRDFCIGDIAAALGFRVFEASSFDELDSAMEKMLSDDTRPAMLVAKTSSTESAEIMKQFINRNNNI